MVPARRRLSTLDEPPSRHRVLSVGLAAALHAVAIGALWIASREPNVPAPERVLTPAITSFEHPPADLADTDALPAEDGPVPDIAPPPDARPPEIKVPPADPFEHMLPEERFAERSFHDVRPGVLELPPSVAVWALEDLAARRAPPAPTPPRPAPSSPRPGATDLRIVASPDPARFYPWIARRRGIEGDVVVRIAVDSNGTVIRAEVAVPSGHAMLDEAALRVARATRFAPGASGAAELPIRFRLR